jgi:hypothetical protein
MGNEWDQFKDEVLGQIGKLRRRIKALDQIVRLRQVAPHDPESRRTILGHMHAVPEPRPRVAPYYTPGIPHRFYGHWAEEEPITGWQITDGGGKVLQVIQVDRDRVEADIAARIEAFHAEHPAPPVEPPVLPDKDRQYAKELAAGDARKETDVLRVRENIHRQLWEESRENHEGLLRTQPDRIREAVWTEVALDAARKVFPVCVLHETGCGYNIVL